ETRHRPDDESTVRNAPAAAPGAALRGGDVVECPLIQKVRQLDDPRGRNTFALDKPFDGRGAVGKDVVGKPIAPAVEGHETRSRNRIEPASAGNDAAAAEPGPGGGEDIGVDIARMHDADFFAAEISEETQALNSRAQ